MKRTTIIPLLALALLGASSCATSIKRNLADTEGIEQATDTLRGIQFILYENDPEWTRYNADDAFSRWAKENRITVTAKRLLSVSPKEDCIQITYDYRSGPKKSKRITIVMPDFRKEKKYKPKFGERPTENPHKRNP